MKTKFVFTHRAHFVRVLACFIFQLAAVFSLLHVHHHHQNTASKVEAFADSGCALCDLKGGASSVLLSNPIDCKLPDTVTYELLETYSDIHLVGCYSNASSRAPPFLA